MDAWIGNPELHGDEIVWKPAEESADIDMLRPASDPFRADGGMKLVKGNLGRAIFKTSAVDEERWTIEAPARCFSDQNEVLEAFKAGELDRDCRGRRPLPGPARQRHARAAQADAGARRGPGPRLQRRADHRRAHVGRERQGARRDPRLARGAARRPAGAAFATATSSGCARDDGQLEAVGVDLGSRPPANSPPPPVGTGRELFALMRLHAERGRSRSVGDARGNGGRASVRQIAVADVGGTHARFALAEIEDGRVVSLGEPVTLKTADHASFQLAWQEFGRQAGSICPMSWRSPSPGRSAARSSS